MAKAKDGRKHNGKSRDGTQDFVIDARRANVSKLKREGMTQAQIARRLKCSRATVQADIAHLRDFWRGIAALDFDHLMGDAVEQLHTARSEAWRAWAVSKTIEAPWGDPRYLALVRQLTMDIRELLGLDDPVRFQALRVRDSGDEADGVDFLLVTVTEREEVKLIQKDGDIEFLSFARLQKFIRHDVRRDAGLLKSGEDFEFDLLEVDQNGSVVDAIPTADQA